MDSCTYNLRQGHPYYQNLVNRITKMLDLPYTITVYESDTPNACATLYKRCSVEPQKPVIAYNPLFIENIRRKSHWAVIAVFAHEVAHHYNEDLFGKYSANLLGDRYDKRSHQQELNADKVAGWVLHKEGATIDEALQMYNVVTFRESYTHPSGLKRKRAMIDGWAAANKSVPKKLEYKPNFDALGHTLVAVTAIGILIALLSDD